MNYLLAAFLAVTDPLLAIVAAITYIELDVAILTRIAGFLLPLLVGLVTKKVSTAGLKATLLLILSSAAGIVAVMIEADGKIPVAQFIDAILNTLTTAAASYYGFLKPTGISDYVIEKTRNIGIGSPPSPPLETKEKGAQEEGEATAAAGDPPRDETGRFTSRG